MKKSWHAAYNAAAFWDFKRMMGQWGHTSITGRTTEDKLTDSEAFSTKSNTRTPQSLTECVQCYCHGVDWNWKYVGIQLQSLTARTDRGCLPVLHYFRNSLPSSANVTLSLRCIFVTMTRPVVTETELADFHWSAYVQGALQWTQHCFFYPR